MKVMKHVCVWAAIQSNARRTNYYVVSFGDHKISMYNLFGVKVCGRLLHNEIRRIHEWAQRHPSNSVP